MRVASNHRLPSLAVAGQTERNPIRGKTLEGQVFAVSNPALRCSAGRRAGRRFGTAESTISV